MYHSSRVMAHLWKSFIPLCALNPYKLSPTTFQQRRWLFHSLHRMNVNPQRRSDLVGDHNNCMRQCITCPPHCTIVSRTFYLVITGCHYSGVLWEPAAKLAVRRHYNPCPSIDLWWKYCVRQGDKGPETQDAELQGEAQVVHGLNISVCGYTGIHY